ncbi:MAG: hypothetical protein Q9162_001441 [Coniocarpon cinnabarinum]
MRTDGLALGLTCKAVARLVLPLIHPINTFPLYDVTRVHPQRGCGYGKKWKGDQDPWEPPTVENYHAFAREIDFLVIRSLVNAKYQFRTVLSAGPEHLEDLRRINDRTWANVGIWLDSRRHAEPVSRFVPQCQSESVNTEQPQPWGPAPQRPIPSIQKQLLLLGLTLVHYPWLILGASTVRFCIGCQGTLPSWPPDLPMEQRLGISPMDAVERYLVCDRYPGCYKPREEASSKTLINIFQEGFVPDFGVEAGRAYWEAQRRMKSFLYYHSAANILLSMREAPVPPSTEPIQCNATLSNVPSDFANGNTQSSVRLGIIDFQQVLTQSLGFSDPFSEHYPYPAFTYFDTS